MYLRSFLGTYLMAIIVSFSQSTRDVPPRIVSQPPKELAYKEGEQATLACEAQGQPVPRFEWKKDEKPLAITGVRLKWAAAQLSSGTITIEEPDSSDEGIYQCFARNNWGTAVGGKTLFKKAVLEPFPSVKQPKIHRLNVGSSFTLNCTPPLSYPLGLIYWGENKPGSRLKPMENTARISLDYSGNLHFANVQPEDHRRGFSYACILDNLALRSLVQGDDQIIYPINVTTGQPSYVSPHLMWSSETPLVAIWGETLKMKCIFAGFPTPLVKWERTDAQLSPSAQILSFGQEIVIRNVQFDDEGTYRCSATNIDNGSPVVQDFDVIIESMPYWRQGQAPEDVNVAEDESAQISCVADGKPKPTISWFINGRPVQDLPDPRRTVTDQAISYSSVTKADKQVIQCNASNVHGYILANAYINVLAEPPSFTRTPKSVIKVAEGENVTLTCRVFGAPKPKISWYYLKSSESTRQPVALGSKFLQQNTGDLWLKGLKKEDSGRYKCYATNKFGEDEVSGEVLVRERTVITEGPKNRVVNASSTVVFPCNAQTDPLESSNLVIEWHRNGKIIDFLYHPHMEHNAADNSLIITGVESADSANYSCVAKNGVDQSVATAQLFVHDRPDPPVNVRLVNNCLSNKAELRWLPGNDNNNKIIEFIIYVNTSYDPPDRFKEEIRVPESASLYSAVLSLLPWTTYSFHVTARNSVGESLRSRFTSEDVPCSTPATMPYRHPGGVCSESRGEEELVIVWQPMEPSDHNGEKFHYLVGYKLRNDETDPMKELSVYDWRASETVIPNQPIFQEYVIFVKAVNSRGEAPSSNLTWKLGYSGQGIPAVKPENFSAVSINSSSAEFSWTAIREDVAEIKGFFLGYMIQFWKTDEPQNIRKETIELRSFNPCLVLSKKLKRQAADELSGDKLVTGRTDRLWANSLITAVVVVINGARRAGPTSNSIEFRTPEGVPDAVGKFEVTERGSNHFVVSWDPPQQTNGHLTGYDIEFEEAPSGVVLNKVSVSPSNRRKKITGLKNDTSYVMKIRAATSAGNGPEFVLHERTNPSSAPSKPDIANIKVGSNFAVVTFDSSADKGDSANPGSVHCVEYRPEGGDIWLRSDNVTDESTVNVTSLDEGIAYEIRVVAFNDRETHSASDVTVITTNQRVETAHSTAFLSYLKLIIIAAILFLIIFIACFICYVSHNKGGIYPVNERERKHGCAAGKNDEPDFGEYVRPSEPFPAKSNSSISSLTGKKSPENVDSDNDSLGEYADPDPTKFSEDGSFIGQYGKKPTSNANEMPNIPFSTLI